MTARPQRRAGVGATALTVLVVSVLAACGVPIDDEARITEAEQVPFDLLSGTTTTLPTGTPPDGETTICLEIDGSLLSLGRDRSGDPPLYSLEALVVAGPTEGEATLGLRSVLEGDDAITSVRRSADGAIVELGPDFAELPADQQLLAVAQITCTLTTQPGILNVAFELEGTEIEVPVQGGELLDRPVTRNDYAGLIAN